ncbi:MAG: FlgD immunoglobulin-like domain containing protein, partial [bacterium]
PVYGDDETTPEVDEGAEVGDTLTFYINEEQATVTDMNQAVWNGDGDMMQIVLSVRTGPPSVIPGEYFLSQNYPNPFNPTTSIQYSVISDQSPATSNQYSVNSEQSSPHITLKVYNLLGQEVRTLVDETTGAGYYTVTWDGRDDNGVEVASGIYFYRLRAGDYSGTRRMLLLK